MTSGPGVAPAAEVGAAGSFSSKAAAAVVAPAASADFWSQLVTAQTSDQLCRAWLGILCQWIPDTRAGLLLLHQDDDSFAPAAVWPDPQRDLSYLGEVAQQSLVERRGVVVDEAGGTTQCAYPLLTAEQAFGVVVLHVATRGDVGMRDALRILHWGAGWLVGLFDRRRMLADDHRLRRSGLLQDLLLGVIAEPRSDDAARWVVNRLAEGLPCRQAMLASGAGATLELIAVSGTAGFEPRSNLLAAATEAMRQAGADGQAVTWPVAATADRGSTDAAEEALADYAREAAATAVIALPLVHQGRAVGALLLDWDQPPPADDLAFARTLAQVLAPGLALQRDASRGLIAHARDGLAAAWHGTVGPQRAGAKALVLLALVLVAASLVVETSFMVRAPATIEGQVQRAAVAPFDGFVAAAPARAGDAVHAGDLLARLDDRDLKLDLAKSQADAELAERRLRDAMARSEAVAVRVAQAEFEQTSAELALVRERLARSAITAPFDGVVVKGDLSQQLGAPVETGRVLFEIAPLDAWRVVVKVDERDIVHVRDGQDAELVLAGLPGTGHRLTISRVSPVALAEDGRTSFRVEARVQGGAASIQPGMEGVVRIDAGRRTWFWIGFHRVADWARYTAWTLGW
jgi:RND family efflux transporter MFP subunit